MKAPSGISGWSASDPVPWGLAGDDKIAGLRL